MTSTDRRGLSGKRTGNCDFGNETKLLYISTHEGLSELGRQFHGAQPLDLLNHRQHDWTAKAEEGEKVGRRNG